MTVDRVVVPERRRDRRPHQPVAAGRPRPHAVVALAAALVAVVVYLPGLGNGFAYDDVPLLLGDPRVRPPYAWGEIFTRPYWYVAGDEHALYRPLATASFALDWVVSGAAPAWAHAVNLVLHAVSAALVALLLCELVPPSAALGGALLFAIHPVHVEAVANVAGRAELLAAAFFLGACVLWLRRRRDGGVGPRAFGAALLGTAAIFSKESAVMLPAVLLLLDRVVERGDGRETTVTACVRGRGGELALVLIGPVLYIVARTAVIGLHSPTVVHPAAEGLTGAGPRLLTALQAWPEYARLLFFPRTLLIDYGPQVVGPATSWNIPAGVGLLLLASLLGLGAVATARGRWFMALALLWFPVTVFPVSNLAMTIGVLVAERTLYVPSVALSIAVAGVLARFGASGAVLTRRIAWVALGGVILAFSARTLQRTPEWDSTERIFRAQVRDRPDSYRGHWYLGRLERANGNVERAAEHFAEALRLWPYRRGLVLEAATFAIERQRIGEARDLAAFATRQWPTSVEAFRLLAATSLDLGDTVTARVAVRDGLRLDPDDELLNRMGDVVRITDLELDESQHDAR